MSNKSLLVKPGDRLDQVYKFPVQLVGKICVFISIRTLKKSVNDFERPPIWIAMIQIVPMVKLIIFC